LLTGTTLYLWDQGGDTYSSSDYASINGAGSVAGGGGNRSLGYVAPGQSFFVHATTSGNIQFNNAMRKTYANQFFKTTTQNFSTLKLSITGAQNQYNQLLVAISDQATDGFDNLYDGQKVKGNPNLAFYSLLDQQDMAIQTIAPLVSATKTVKIGYDITAAGQYTIKVDEFANFSEQIYMYLIDNLTNTSTEITPATTYTFTSDAGIFKNRFELKFSNSPLSVTNLETQSDCKIYYFNGQLHFNGLIAKELQFSQVELCNAVGQIVFSGKLKNNQSSIAINLKAGIYIAKINTPKGVFAQKIVTP